MGNNVYLRTAYEPIWLQLYVIPDKTLIPMSLYPIVRMDQFEIDCSLSVDDDN